MEVLCVWAIICQEPVCVLLCVVPFLISSFGLPLAPHFLLCGGMAFQWVILFLIPGGAVSAFIDGGLSGHLGFTAEEVLLIR